MLRNIGMNLIYDVKESITINDVLSKKLNISTRLKNKLISSKLILLNDQFVDTRSVVKKGDTIKIILDYIEDNSNIVSKKGNLDILYEDEFLLIINKPAGLPVHPSILHYSDSIANCIKWYYDSINLHKKIRAVNRIDLNTSGIVLFAKNEYIQECLIKQMQNNSFKKNYLALLSGKLKFKEGFIDLPIARKPGSIIERCVSSNGQKAITHYKVLKDYNNYSLVECILETRKNSSNSCSHVFYR